MNQIASALYYLHSYGIAHRDLKLENILLVDESDESPIKLADFGLAKMLGPNETSNEKFGTMGYVAPEVLLGWSYTKSVDLWSLGVIIYILMSGMLPFDGREPSETVRRTVMEPVPLQNPVWGCVSNDAKNLI